MKKLFFIPLLFICFNAYAVLTAGYIPVVKTGGSSPTTQNGSMTDTGTPSASGNVGIGSSNPNGTLDVGSGTICLNHVCDSTWPSGGSVANPSASIGLSAVNGSATSAIRSDGAPALSQSIVPTWTGTHTFNGTPIAAVFGGNVGIGSASPGTALDVNGTVRMIALNTTGTGNTLLNTGAGNVGVGTTTPVSLLAINGGVSIGTENNSSNSAPSNGLIVSGNVGIGSPTPGQALDVTGTVRATQFVGGGAGLTGLTSSQWTGTSNLFFNGNVGINTTTAPTNAGLIVATGNVGIDSVAPGTALDVVGTLRVNSLGTVFTVNSANVGIGTSAVGSGLLQVGATSVSGFVACLGTANCLGKCTVLTASTGACSSCACITS